MVSILASSTEAVQWSGGLRRTGRCQMKQPLDGARTLATSLPAICFAANITVITLELALVALEWTFAAVGRPRFESDLRKVGQRHGVKFSQ